MGNKYTLYQICEMYNLMLLFLVLLDFIQVLCSFMKNTFLRTTNAIIEEHFYVEAILLTTTLLLTPSFLLIVLRKIRTLFMKIRNFLVKSHTIVLFKENKLFMNISKLLKKT